MNEVSSTIVDIPTPLNHKLEVSQETLNKNDHKNEELIDHNQTRKKNNWFGFKKTTNKKQSNEIIKMNVHEIVKANIDIYVLYLFLG